ncbi:MAG: cache domain-containing protein [Desulfobacter sp.]
MWKKLKLSTRILLLGIAINICFTAIFFWLYPKIKSNMYDAKSLKTRHLVESAWSVIDHYAHLSESGEMTADDARKAAIAAVKHMRYEKQDYFWINDTRPYMVMHPTNPKLDNTDVAPIKDPTGKALFIEMVDIAQKDGQGFVRYYWPKPGSSEPVPKISFVKLHPSWEWIIGSGIYIDDVRKEIREIFYTILIAIFFVTAAGLIISFMMASSISKPINRIIDKLNIVANEITSASSQVSMSSQSLASGATQQAASIEKTSASLEHMASMTRDNADNSQSADRLMKETHTVVQRSGNSMNELTDSMNAITEASEETSSIIKTIDEIAFQTNLLALNASVEAARAGEAGAGFAVVADEVRSLAIRAAEASKNTAKLIEDIVEKIQNGSQIVGTTSGDFFSVSGNVDNAGELVDKIATANSEQAKGIESINQAVTEMDLVIQQNAAGAEESAAAAEQMNAQSELMKQMVAALTVVVTGHNSSQDDPEPENG